jgi:hypothetical protein
MPNLSINNLKSFLMEHPPVMGNKFEIKIMHDRPTAIELSCTNVNLPGRTFSTNPHTGIPGPDIKFPYQVAYEDAVISFITTNNLIQRKYFEDWMDSINPRPQNKFGYSKFQYRKNYLKEIEIHTLDDLGIMNYKTTLQNAYPIGIQATELSHANEAIMLTNVTITYSHYT